jgi:hypothetical protein
MTSLPAIRCSQLPSLTLPMCPKMHKFNLIVLSLLFILSVTAAAPVEPEQGIVKRDDGSNGDGTCTDDGGPALCTTVSIDFMYARRLEPTEPLADSLP